jgi:anthranilate phosphoribosyltransferase
MKHVVPVRKALGVRTIFNFLGPLTNPAGARRQLLGVSDRRYQETIAEALAGLGCERALVVTSDEGVDEISVTGRTRVIEVIGTSTEEWFVAPEDMVIERAELGAIAGGSPDENAATVRAVFAGDSGPARDVVLLNAGAAILAADGAPDLGSGVDRARQAIDSGAAQGVLQRLVELTGTLSPA